jgi:pyridoxamine 5'-phosphate oxidase
MSLADLRRNYTRQGLLETDTDPDPVVQFQRWFDQALHGGVVEPNAMTLATATADGYPSARIVLLKGIDSRGLTFFTNYQSRKGEELLNNPRAALVFFWHDLERQVRVEGTVVQSTREESESYFATRPRESRLGAWASKQSSIIASREELEASQREFDTLHADQEIPCPPMWGGYRVIPHTFEFWQGRPSRLHDRIRYRLVEGVWKRERLSP